MLKKSVSLCLSFVLLLGVLFCLPVSASAASSKITYLKTLYSYNVPDQTIVNEVYPGGPYYYKGDYYSNLKSSNKNVKLSICSLKNGNGQGIRLTSTNFTGTANISFKYHETTYSFKYIVKPYYNPAKHFKIGQTEHAQKYNNKSTLISRVIKVNKPLKIEAKSGWIISSVKTVTTGGPNSRNNGIRTYKPNSSTFSGKITLYTAAHTVNSYNNYIEVTYKQKSTGRTTTQIFRMI